MSNAAQAPVGLRAYASVRLHAPISVYHGTIAIYQRENCRMLAAAVMMLLMDNGIQSRNAVNAEDNARKKTNQATEHKHANEWKHNRSLF
jgi:hypothetical protein